MSSQKGNAKRARPQKYQNRTVFRNDLHDKTRKIKFLNNLDIANVCERCKKIIEWKIKYKKYKPLKAPSKCTKCDQKSIKHAYHTMCLPCAKEYQVCPKCGQKGEIVDPQPTKEESLKLDAELQALLKSLSERKRRTFMRYMNRNADNKKKKKSKDKEPKGAPHEAFSEDDEDDDSERTPKPTPVTRDDLLQKLKELKLKDGSDDMFDSDLSNFGDDDDDGDDENDIDDLDF